jgi:hypothetical protein
VRVGRLGKLPLPLLAIFVVLLALVVLVAVYLMIRRWL